MDKYCPDGQPCESSGCSGIRCHRFELHATSDIRTYPYAELCPHCASKDAEIAALRERVKRAERWIGRITYDDGLPLSIKQRRDGHRILRGEGE